MKKTAPSPRKTAPSVSASARLPKGYLASGTAAGLKASGAPDMGLLFSDRPALVAGVFTSNQVKAAHVRLDAQRIATYGVAQAVANDLQVPCENRVHHHAPTPYNHHTI